MSFSRKELFEYAEKYIDISINDECDVFTADCELIEFLLDNCEIQIPKENHFFVNVNCNDIKAHIDWKRCQRYVREIIDNGLYEGQEASAFSGSYDFSHTTAEWQSVISLGISGLRNRVIRYADKNKGDKKSRTSICKLYKFTMQRFDS